MGFECRQSRGEGCADSEGSGLHEDDAEAEAGERVQRRLAHAYRARARPLRASAPTASRRAHQPSRERLSL